MTIINQNFTMYAGESKNIVGTIRDGNNNVIDLTGAIIKWELQGSQSGGNYVVYKDTTNGISSSNPTSGTFTITLNPIDTQNLSGNYYHSAKVIDILGNSEVVFIGIITILKSF